MCPKDAWTTRLRDQLVTQSPSTTGRYQSESQYARVLAACLPRGLSNLNLMTLAWEDFEVVHWDGHSPTIEIDGIHWERVEGPMIVGLIAWEAGPNNVRIAFDYSSDMSTEDWDIVTEDLNRYLGEAGVPPVENRTIFFLRPSSLGSVMDIQNLIWEREDGWRVRNPYATPDRLSDAHRDFVHDVLSNASWL